MTESDSKDIFEALEKGDPVLLKAALSKSPNVNVVDDNFMSPLQHAAYKGNKEILQMLLDQGANVNFCEHQHNYTALHFAALSGNIDVCLALLAAGAKSTTTNTVGRTPSQMAAFVGHHNCVAVINTFVPKEHIEEFTKPTGPDNQPILPPFLVESLHKFIMQVNIHPVKVVLNTHSFVGLLDHLQEVKNVLDLLSEREMKHPTEVNEVLSFKFHYLGYILGEVIKIRQRQLAKKEDAASASDDDKKLDITEVFTRKLLKPGKDGNLEFLDSFLRECVREFPFRESTLFRQIVASLAGNEPPSALSVVISAINGQRGFLDNIAICDTCGEEKPLKKCSKCKVVQYCDRNCQRLHWHWHKKSCARLAQEVGALEPATRAAPSANEISADLQNMLVN